jgi:hypothetical protein
MTLEERIQESVDLEVAGRATSWTIADKWAAMYRDFGKAVVGEIATAHMKSAEYVRQHIRVAVAFPRDAERHSDVDFSLYLESMRAAHRAQPERQPVDVLREALDKDMSASEVKWLYRDPADKPPVLRFAATCKMCGSRVIVYVPKEMCGFPVECPMCGGVGSKPLLGRVE